MNLEEIKDWVEDNRLCAWTPQMIVEHLIAEVERYKVALDNMTEVARLAQEAASTAEIRAVTRCAEIADWHCCDGCEGVAADAIRKEYGIEP